MRVEPVAARRPRRGGGAPRTLVVGGGHGRHGDGRGAARARRPGWRADDRRRASPTLPVRPRPALAGARRRGGAGRARAAQRRRGSPSAASSCAAARRRRASTRRRRAPSWRTASVRRVRPLVLATGSQPCVPPIAGPRAPRRARLPLAARRRARSSPRAARRAARRGHRRRPARPGGRARAAAQRGVRGHRRAPRRPPDGAAARPARRARLLERRMRELGIEVLLAATTTEAIAGNGERRGACGSPTARELDADLVVVADRHPARGRARARRAGIEVGRGVVVDDELRTSAPGRAGRSASAPSTAASSTACGRRCSQQAQAAGRRRCRAGRPRSTARCPRRR